MDLASPCQGNTYPPGVAHWATAAVVALLLAGPEHAEVQPISGMIGASLRC